MLTSPVSAAQSAIRARASAEYAYVLLSESRMAEAEAQAKKAIALFDHDPPEAGLVGALGTLGSTFYLQGKFEQALADPELYTETAKARLTSLLAQQGPLTQQLEGVETEWMTLGEELEAKEQAFADGE